MLSKLIKHEFKITGRYILLLMAILAIVTPITAGYLRISSDFLSSDNFTIFKFFNGLSIFLYVIAIIGVGVATFILLLYRFYKSMISSEAYLTHTLPVKTSSLITSKLLVAFVWEIACTLLIVISLLVFTKILGAWQFSDLSWANIRHFFNEFIQIGFNAVNLIEIIVFTLVSCISGLLMCFVSFSIGQRMNGHQFLGSVIAYIVITVIMQIISSVIAFFYSLYFIRLDGIEVNNINPHMHVFMLGMIIMQIVISIAYYVVTVYMFKKKLNI